MRIVRTDDFLKKISDRSVITIGNFDGVHRGHREIFNRVCSHSSADNATSVVMTFDPHPLQILAPQKAPLPITTIPQRIDLIAESDIELLLVIPFSSEFADISAEHFLRRILHSSLGLCRLVIGHDYAFGRNREGDEQFLKKFSEELGFQMDVMEPVGDGTIIYSSSAVRRSVLAGDMPSATSILGRCHRVSGTVVHGREIGRSLGFPTANIVTENRLIPADGVYAVRVEVFGELYMGACSIGLNPTFDGGVRTIEVFLFDFDGNLYGQQINIYFAERLRELLRFNDPDSLGRQIGADVARARSVLSSGLPQRPDQ